MVVSTATLDLAGFNETIGSLAGAGDVTLGAGVLNTGGDNTSTTFSGVISGSGGLVKAGSGAFTLTGTNTYSGGTMLLDGMIVVENNARRSAPVCSRWRKGPRCPSRAAAMSPSPKT